MFVFASGGRPVVGWERCTAADLGLVESWFRDAIFDSPSIVIDACRSAGVTDDDWYPWAREFRVEVGPIDVLLVSSQGKVAIVETKLSTNPELRRKVLAQTLDYLAHLPEALEDSMPPLPQDSNGVPVVEVDDIRASMANSEALLIIASDDIDPRVAKLSQSLISDNLVKNWELALVDMALFRPAKADRSDFLVVPSVRNVVIADRRQVIRVVVEGETPRARVQTESAAAIGEDSARRSWSEAEFFAGLKERGAPSTAHDLATKIIALANNNPDSLVLTWGTGRKGSMSLKRHGHSLIEIYTTGMIRFRPGHFARALGESAAASYLAGLQRLAPSPMRMEYPRVSPAEGAVIAAPLHALLAEAIAAAGSGERL